MRRGSVETGLSADMGSVVVPFESMHNFPIHWVCENGGRVLYAQGLHGTGVDETTFENNRDRLI